MTNETKREMREERKLRCVEPRIAFYEYNEEGKRRNVITRG